MCGIAGFLDPANSAFESNFAVLERMTRAIRHRGPDGEGLWQDHTAQVNFGHRRLSIIDLTSTGRQPMTTSNGRWTLTYNGEIYNYRILRSELRDFGYDFAGTSDTEVLLYALAHWGVEPALRRLNGMFAFALWDAQERRLYLARDRFGEKPLYYAWNKRTLLFGSELKAISEHPSFLKEVDDHALSLLIRLNFIPSPYCIFRGAKKLPPGHYLSATVGSPPGLPRPYWSLAEAATKQTQLDVSADGPTLIETVDAALRNAVRLRMAADVPLGAFLSGGIDSSTVVALMQAQSSRPIKTFTIGFWATPYNEAEDAAKIARHLGTEHHDHYLSSLECQSIIERIPSIYDEPFADSSQIPTTLISEFTRRHVTVALSGDGGDELFAGYNRYVWGGRAWPVLARIPSAFRHSVGRAIQNVLPSSWEHAFAISNTILPARLRVRGGSEKLYKLASAFAAQSPDELYRAVISHWRDADEVLSTHRGLPYLDDIASSVPGQLGFVERMMYLDSVSYLPDDILCKVDRASMSVGLEARVPFLDSELTELAWSLPIDVRIRHGVGKWPLRQVLKRYLPERLFERPKAGFGVPVGDWLRGPMREWAEELLSESRLEQGGYFNSAIVRQRWSEHLSGRSNQQHSLWSVLMFQAWLAHWRPNA